MYETNHTDQSLSSEADSCSTSQEIYNILWNLKAPYHAHEPSIAPFHEPDESSPCLPILFFKIHFDIILSAS
jgi:hypothetical protein